MIMFVVMVVLDLDSNHREHVPCSGVLERYTVSTFFAMTVVQYSTECSFVSLSQAESYPESGIHIFIMILFSIRGHILFSISEN
jgi:hypothetical protein